MTFRFFASLFISFTISFILTPFIRQFFIARGWVEDPIQKNLKTNNATALKSLPRGGGLPIFISLLFTSLIMLPVDKHLIGILIAGFLVLIIGLIDDVKDISPGFRLLTNVFAALIVVASGIGIAYLSNPLGGVIDLSWPRFSFDLFGPHTVWLLSDLLALFWITWCMNIVGWSAGVEGQLPGFVAISAIFIGILGFRYSADISQWPVIILSAVVAGSYLGFLPYNIFPQSIMPGYSGKSLSGFLLAVLSILSGAKLATLILILGVPMLDAAYVIIHRLINGQGIFNGGPQHLHHRLLKIGWTRSQVAIFYWSLSLVLGIISLFLNSQQKFYFFLGLLILFFGFTLKFFRRI